MDSTYLACSPLPQRWELHPAPRFKKEGLPVLVVFVLWPIVVVIGLKAQRRVSGSALEAQNIAEFRAVPRFPIHWPDFSVFARTSTLLTPGAQPKLRIVSTQTQQWEDADGAYSLTHGRDHYGQHCGREPLEAHQLTGLMCWRLVFHPDLLRHSRKTSTHSHFD